MAAASWDKTVRVWDVRKDSNTSCQIQARTMFTHDAPILACCFSRQNALFSAGCDNIVKVHNLATNQSQTIGKHDAPISGIAFDDERNLCITGSWDSTVRYWDCRQPNPAHTTHLNAKVYCMDYKSPVLVIGGSDRKVHAISMQNPQAPPTVIETLLRLQMRSISVQPTRQGFAVASIEGRCSLVFFDDPAKGKRFAFKCHRVDERGVQKVYPVNCLGFHPIKQTAMLTAGSDGMITLWDTGNKIRLRDFENMGAPVTQAVFDAAGELLGCAASYDWHKGYSGCDHSKIPSKLVIRTISQDMLTKS